MFNVTVIKMKDIKKYLIGMVVTVSVVILASKYLPQNNSNDKILNKVLSEQNMVGCLDKTVPTIATIEESNNDKKQEEQTIKQADLLQGILKTQISSIQGIESIEKTEENSKTEETKPEPEQENQNVEVAKAETGLPTQVITNNPLKESFNAQYGNVKIKNETEYTLTEGMLRPDITIENKNIILFHTHSCESYTSSDAYPYTPTGTYRTTDLNFSVTRVGTELENQLKQYNYNVVHDTSYHDYPAYNGSYTRSLATVENILKQTPADIIMDVHRDAIGSRSDYAPIVKIGENDVAAQIMFVIRD